MKWKLASLLAVLTLAVAVTLPLFAQQADDDNDDNDDVVWSGPWGHRGGMGDDGGKSLREELALTKEQLKKMDEMRSTHQNEMIPLRAQVQVKQIELNELFNSDASLSTVNSKIDEISKLRTDIAKKQAAYRIAMRQLLTPEQREIWDSHSKMGMMGMRGKAMMERGAKMGRMFNGQGEGPRGRGRGL